MRKSLVFGGTSTDLLASFSQSDINQSWCWKMSQTSFEWADPTLLEVLPQSGMTSSGRLYQLHNVEHPTLDAGGLQSPTQAPLDTTCGTLWHLENSLTVDGLLPTPTKTGAEHRTRYSQGGRPLMYMIQQGLLPTPTSTQFQTKRKRQRAIEQALAQQPLKARYRANGDYDSGNRMFSILDAVVYHSIRNQINLPTPTVSASKNNPDTPSIWNRNSSLNARAAKMEGLNKTTGKGFRLNPRFVEEMMGFPIGWTDLELSETLLSHNAPNGLDNKS